MTDAQQERVLRDVYADELVPAAARLRARGVEFFALGPEPERSTFYVQRRDRTDYVVAYASARFADELRRRWTEEGIPELVDLVDSLAATAESLEGIDTSSEEVSPFIYAMF